MGKKTFRDLTSFKIGGEIAHYFEAATKAELTRVVKKAKAIGKPIFILGGGTDILASDDPFNGVVVRFTGRKLKINSLKFKIEITAQAGMLWDDLVKFAVENNLQGIECLSGIPGTVGAAPIQNIGAYGQELKDTFVSLTAYSIEKEKFVNFNKKECYFSYRESIFKKPENWQKYVIVDVTLRLKKGGKPSLNYESLQNHPKLQNTKTPKLKDIRNVVLEIRAGKFENPHEVGNAGSFFKNPIVNVKIKNQIVKSYPDAKIYPSGRGFKISAGWLIEKAGWKGKKYGNAAVSPRHALILLNQTGRAKAEEIFNLSQRIIDDVYEKFGIKLEREVQLINFPRKIAILGYGIEGQDAEKYIKKQKLKSKIAILDQKFDKDYLKDLDKYDLIIRSAGVYPYKPELKNAKVTTPVQIFFNECRGKIIGVTGTKGKGTTATLIYQILKKAGMDVYLAGNIGKPYLALLPLIHHTSYITLELSSFQLIDLKSSPHIAVVLNVTSDHLDWHKNQEEYVNAKKNIVRFQKPTDYAVINEEYKTPRSFARETQAKVIFFSKQKLEEKFKKDLLLRGEHNLENIAAAVAVARILKIDDNIILKVVRNFKGLEHRLELVEEVKGRTFYNDSFATGPQPTIAAIRSFTEPMTLILGGSDKGLDYRELGFEIEKHKNIKNIILIGETRLKIKNSIKIKNSKLKILDLGKSSMAEIVKIAFKETEPGGVVLLSPASASFDMFANYKDRGNQFKEAVRSLK